jgi:putative lipoprotein
MHPSAQPLAARRLLVLAAALAPLLTASCAMTRDNVPTVTLSTIAGTVAYRQRIALPPDAVVKVTLADVTAADAPAKVIANLTFATEGRQVPLPFSLRFDGSRLDPNRVYSVSARIDQGARMLFVTDSANRVDPKALPTNLELMLVPASPSS